MSVISDGYDRSNLPLNTNRGQYESLKNFENRFSAALSKFISFSSTTKLPQDNSAVMFLGNAQIERSQ